MENKVKGKLDRFNKTHNNDYNTLNHDFILYVFHNQITWSDL